MDIPLSLISLRELLSILDAAPIPLPSGATPTDVTAPVLTFLPPNHCAISIIPIPPNISPSDLIALKFSKPTCSFQPGWMFLCRACSMIDQVNSASDSVILE